ncbi:DNA-packaging protein [Aurantiacibacter gangjinensis]|uniref:ATP-binding protein n=1 Tax=Aurantiacibacter gangjinensis TaxID=502682 RepID=A0A0G9MLW8_9SPHN|nr:terminase family protein [Aurantiacibacter gangjinensis]APE27665.1 Gene Transfer Agent terminase protein [Aurantiacibacter gangjinensis]KLE31682.1 ATP-binding protein [Aurantiacibacter gangjinensis]
MTAIERGAVLSRLDDDKRGKFLGELSDDENDILESYWPLWARAEQMPPAARWRLWLICAGRGFGKTRAGAEWVRHIAEEHDEARIALVARSIGEARAVMVEGESGILACCDGSEDRPFFEPSLRRLTWPSGAQATLYSAGEPESLRGPQHSHAWCDEIAKWDNAGDRALTTWDNLQMGLRLGEHPQVLATTTPRAVPLMRRLMGDGSDGDVVVTRGSSYDNAENLPAEFLAAMKRQYGSSALGRQELDGKLLEDVDGALWSRSMLEACREPFSAESIVRIVIGVDPPASSRGDACGIVVAGVTADGQGKVLADASIAQPSPDQWARRVAATAAEWRADRVVAEANQGGEMVASVLRAADCQMPLKLVHASHGKVARAEPVAALYETGRVNHVGHFPALEDELCGLMTGGDYQGPGHSPDRADALVWALTELMLGRRGEPRVRRF